MEISHTTADGKKHDADLPHVGDAVPLSPERLAALIKRLDDAGVSKDPALRKAMWGL